MTESTSDSDQVPEVPPLPAREIGRESQSERAPSKADLYIETGLTPAEYICAAIEQAGGRLRQQAICSYTGWSEPTVSRTLSEMESQGTVTRFQLGTEKIVYLPHAAPDQTSVSVGNG